MIIYDAVCWQWKDIFVKLFVNNGSNLYLQALFCQRDLATHVVDFVDETFNPNYIPNIHLHKG